MTDLSLTAAIKIYARDLGFDLCCITPVADAPHGDFFTHWLAQGRAGEMSYLERNADKRRSPALLGEAGAPPLRSLIVLGVDYHQFDLPPSVRDDPSRGLIASYAWGEDYHDLIRPLLYELDGFVRSRTGRATLAKALVDTGPVLERDWAAQAGLGFTGKNTCTIAPGLGSWLLLAVLIVPEVLEYDQPHFTRPATCGRCTRCLTACPTNAFAGPYDLDPRRCISYWTIEAKGPIPPELRPRFGNRIFGCDICQEVCPYNRRLAEHTPLLAGLAALEPRIAPPLLAGFDPALPYWLDDGAFRTHFRRSPIVRAKRRGMLRNVCVALGNWGAAEALAGLAPALADPEPLVRQHAVWAVAQVRRRQAGTAAAEQAAALLQAIAQTESNSQVLAELK